MRASRSFGWPDGGMVRVWRASIQDTPLVETAPEIEDLVSHLATDGPMLMAQAVRRLTGTEKDLRGQQLVRQWVAIGWLESCDWQAPGPTGARVRQVVRLVGLGPGATRQYGVQPRWGWESTVVCRGAVLAQLLLRLPPDCRWRPMQPQRPLVGRLDLEGRRAWVVILRRSRDMQRQCDAVIADFTRSDVGPDDRVWIVVPSDESEDHDLATRLIREGKLAERALVTSDWAIWDPERPLSAAFSRWSESSWKPVVLANIKEMEARARTRDLAPAQ